MNARQQSRATRRLTYRSRSTTVVAALVALSVVLAWVGTEAVVSALGRPALLVSPSDAARYVAESSWVPLASAGVALLGVVLIVVSLLPGRRARRRLVDDRAVIVIDDVVLAGAISRAAASAGRVPAGHVQTALSRRAARVRVTPCSGFRVPTGEIEAAVGRVLDSAALSRPLARTIDIDDAGVLA